MTSVVETSPVKQPNVVSESLSSEISLAQPKHVGETVKQIIPASVTKESSTVSLAQPKLVSGSQASSPTVPISTHGPTESNSGNLALSFCNPIPILSSNLPVLDPNASSSKMVLSELPSSDNLDNFNFGPKLQVNKISLEDMFELPNKRKASNSPPSTEKSKKDRKAAKKEQKSREKHLQKSRSQLDAPIPTA